MTYFPGGRLQYLTDGNGNKTTYSYDAFGRLDTLYYPDPTTAGTSSSDDYDHFEYNLNSQVEKTFSRRSHNEIRTPRDALGRVTGRVAVGGDIATENINFGYDLQGRLLAALNASSQGITQTYDALGRLDTRTAYGKQLAYKYYLDGTRQRLTYPGGGFYVEYGYTPGGQLQTITDNSSAVLATYSHDGLGVSTGLTRGLNSASSSYQPDALERLHQLNQTATGLNLQASFEYNPAGQITKKTLNNDAYGWTPPTPNSTLTSIPDGQNQLTSLGGVTVADDNDGNVKTGFNSLTYSYDALGELRQATGGASTVNVDYDPAGMLRQVTNGTASTQYVYDGGDLVATYPSSGNATLFVHGPGVDEPLVTMDAVTGTKTWLHADERGSIIASTNGSGALVSSVKYSDSGEASGTLVSPFGYTGQLYLQELQLYYYKARMYSPKAGRFLQPDPSGYAGGMNLYGYVGGDPVNMVDPFGLCGESSTIPDIVMQDCMQEVTVSAYGCDLACQLSQALNRWVLSLVTTSELVGGVDTGGSGGPQGDPGKCWNGEQGDWTDFLGGMGRRVGNDFTDLGRLANPIGGAINSILYGDDPFGANNTNLGMLGSDLAPVAESVIPVARAGYVLEAARIPGIAGITGSEAFAMRSSLKLTYRLGLFPNAWMGSYAGLLAKGRTDAQIIASAGRTNPGVNGAAAASAAAAAAGKGCP